MLAHKFILGLIKGVLTGAAITGLLWILGIEVSMFVYLLLCLGATTLASTAFSYRAHRQWQQIVDTYHRPAFGEGFDTPNRPPKDDQ